MSNKKVIPSIHIPIQRPDGSMEWVWYMFLQWLSENSKQTITTGEENGTIAVNGTDVPVKGLDTAAYHSDDDYVHKHGPEETITSEKRFTAPVSRKLASYAYTETPSEQIWCSYYACDKNNETWAACDFVKGTSGQNIAGLAVKGADGTWCDTGLGIAVTLAGETYTYAPIPPATSSTSDKQIATCGWVNDYTLSTGIVHKAGFEVITDAKAFHVTDGVPIMLRNTTDDSTVAPSALKAISVGIEDKNGVWQGGWEHYHAENGNVYKNMAVKQPGANNYAVIQVGITPSGAQWTSAPTPNTNSWDTNIATTAFVKNVLNAIWPVGAIYLSITNYCPLQGICGNWELIQAGRALWTGNGQTGNYSWTGDKETAAHNVIWQQLPNVSGYATWDGTQNFAGAGGFAYSSVNTGVATGVGSGYSQFRTILDFTASASSSIYSGTRVQPEAYVVNVWRRIS